MKRPVISFRKGGTVNVGCGPSQAQGVPGVNGQIHPPGRERFPTSGGKFDSRTKRVKSNSSRCQPLAVKQQRGAIAVETRREGRQSETKEAAAAERQKAVRLASTHAGYATVRSSVPSGGNEPWARPLLSLSRPGRIPLSRHAPGLPLGWRGVHDNCLAIAAVHETSPGPFRLRPHFPSVESLATTMLSRRLHPFILSLSLILLPIVTRAEETVSDAGQRLT